jgi:hypothetical protein
MDVGIYRIEVRIFGAVSTLVLMGTELFLDERMLGSSVATGDNGRFLVSAEVRCETATQKELCIQVPETTRGYGLEVESIRFIGLS